MFVYIFGYTWLFVFSNKYTIVKLCTMFFCKTKKKERKKKSVTRTKEERNMKESYLIRLRYISKTRKWHKNKCR